MNEDKKIDQELLDNVKKYLAVGGGVLLAAAAVLVAVEWLKPGSTPLKKLRGYKPCCLRFEEEVDVEGDD